MNLGGYIEALLALPEIWGSCLRRDGRWVAWSWMRAGQYTDVYAAPTDGSREPLKLTDSPDDTFLVCWTPDNRSVIVKEDRGGNERDQLFEVFLERPQEMIPLTEAEPAYFIRGGVMTPDRRYLIYGMNYDLQTRREIEPTWVYRQDLETGERVALACPQKPGYLFPLLSPDGKLILYNRSDLHPAGRQIWLVDSEGRQDRELINFGPQTKTFASWFPDSRRVLVLAETPTHRRVGVLDLGNPGPATQPNIQWLLDDPQRNIESVHVPFGTEEGISSSIVDAVVLHELQGAQLRSSLLDPVTDKEYRLPEVRGNLSLIGPVPSGGWAAGYSNSQQPGDLVRLYLGDVQPDCFESLTRVWERTRLHPEDLACAHSHHWASKDGLDIQGWLYQPEGKPKGTVVFIHGGPTYHSQDEVNAQIQLFVKAGFNVLDPNYRGSTGFSVPFKNAIKVQGWGSLEQEDIRSGIESLIAAGIAEPGKIGVTGTSFGGYSSWWAITHFPPELVAASAPICGMTDLVVDYEMTRPDLRPYSEEMLGGSPAQNPQRYYERSPIHFIQNIQGKLLIVQGEQDPNVHPENVRQVRQVLDQAGIDYEVLTFTNEGHGIHKPENLQVLYRRLVEFFEEAFGVE